MKGSCILVLVVRIRTYDVNVYRRPVCSARSPTEMPVHLFFHLIKPTVPVLYVL